LRVVVGNGSSAQLLTGSAVTAVTTSSTVIGSKLDWTSIGD